MRHCYSTGGILVNVNLITGSVCRDGNGHDAEAAHSQQCVSNTSNNHTCIKKAVNETKYM